MSRAHDEVELLLAPYALRVVDRHEQALVEEHVAHCERCRERLGEFEGTAGVLAFSVERDEVAAALRRRIMAQIEERAGASARSAPAWRRLLPVRRLALVPAAALAIVAAAVLAVATGAPWSGDPVARDRVVALDGRGALAGASGRLTIGARDAVELRNVPAPPSGSVWQAWAIDSAGVPRSMGTVTSAQTRLVMELPDDVAGVAVTREPRGGSTRPTSEPLLVARV